MCSRDTTLGLPRDFHPALTHIMSLELTPDMAHAFQNTLVSGLLSSKSDLYRLLLYTLAADCLYFLTLPSLSQRSFARPLAIS